MIDLYRLDRDFTGFDASIASSTLTQRLETLERALHADIVADSGCRPDHFIPHIQPHEFEALLFSDVATLVRVNPGWESADAALSAVRAAASSPEHINDRPETRPTAHLERELRTPKYRKRLHGPIAAERIGLARIEAECAHFAAWAKRIRSLGR